MMTDALMLGMTYRAEFDADLKGNVRFKNIPDGVPIPDQTNIELEWDNPQWLEAGLRYELPGDRAIIGFRGALKNELTERTLARRGTEHRGGGI